MLNTWRRLAVFISSTFKDMDLERDVIKQLIIPALNKRYHSKMIQIQAIDLRHGIDTSGLNEADSENKILDICMKCIDSARPFFIGLLGDRYGWIPTSERISDFISRQHPSTHEIFDGIEGLSVTELEIIYAISHIDDKPDNNCVFFLRREESYRGIPEIFQGIYHDNDEFKEKKERLIERIAKRYSSNFDEICYDYSLKWDIKQNRFIDFDDFITKVTSSLIRYIDLEIEGEHDTESLWFVQESHNAELLAKENLYNKIELYDTYRNHDYRHLIYSSPTGYGKSVILAQEYSKSKRKDSVLALYAVAGSSENSITMRQILVRWIMEIHQFFNNPLPDDNSLLNESKTSLRDLFDNFDRTVDMAKENGYQIELFLDNIESFNRFGSNDIYMAWLSPRFKFRGCIDSNYVGRMEFADVKIVDLDNIDESNTIKLIMHYNKQYFYELLPSLKDKVLDDCRCPLHIRIIYMLLVNLSSEDYIKIRQDNSAPIDAINNYLLSYYENLPKNLNELFVTLAETIIQHLGISRSYFKALQYIAISPTGIREDDLESVLGKEWSSLSFHMLTNLLSDFLYEDSQLNSWRFKDAKIGELLTKDVDKEAYYGNMAEVLHRYSDEDSEKERLLAYYAINSSRSDIAEEWLCSSEICYDNFNRLDKISLALSYWIYEKDFVGNLIKTSSGISDINNRVSLIAIILIGSTANKLMMSHPLETKLITDYILSDIDVESLTDIHLYEIASLAGNMTLLGEHILSLSPLELKHYAEIAAKAYRMCYRKYNSYRDSKNMLIAMLTKLMMIYSMTGDFSHISLLFEETQTLSR